MNSEDVQDYKRRFEYAKSGRSACKGKCKSKIDKDALRYGTLTSFGDSESWTWRCLRCVTDRQAKNVVNEKIPIGYDERVPENVRETFTAYLEALANGEDDAAAGHLETLVGAPAPADDTKKGKTAKKAKRPVEEIQADAESNGFSTLNMDDLKELLRSKKLKVSGKKDELVERAEEAFKQT